jgi:predicted O-linked N-acetylglucosamine transferase (SPINDLY family)
VNDEMSQRLAASLDQFIDVRGMSDREVAKLSREMGIDIAVDLNGFIEYSRTGIFAERAAPIQVNYLGYPGTMGADYIDYIIADKTIIPEKSQAYYTEKVVYLPNSYQVNDSKRKISERRFTKQEVGLPDNAFVFCCFNNNYKILPATFDSWIRILKAVNGSRLWLPENNSTAVWNLRREAEARGVEGDRLVFAKRLLLDEHLARHRLADLFIDTLPYSAHTTASDALWAGLPVLTCMGESFASRVAGSLLNAIDLSELITSTPEDYEAKAIELAMHPETLNALKAKLERNRLTTPLFDGKLFGKHIEAAYEAMYERYRAGLPIEVIEVPPS